jgi:hypothetical protein
LEEEAKLKLEKLRRKDKTSPKQEKESKMSKKSEEEK